MKTKSLWIVLSVVVALVGCTPKEAAPDNSTTPAYNSNTYRTIEPATTNQPPTNTAVAPPQQ